MIQKIKNILGGVMRAHWAIWLFLFLASITVSGFALRHNNLHAVYLRDQLYAADKSGKGVDSALENLQSYVTSHMNTNLSTPDGIYPPIQLAYTYQRLTKLSVGSDQYNPAQSYCLAHATSSLFSDYVNCIENYIGTHSSGFSQGGSSSVPQALYEFDFISPSWSPDFAGWSLLASALFLAGFIISFTISRIRKRI